MKTRQKELLCPYDFIASDGYPKVFIDDSAQMLNDVPQLIDKQLFVTTQSTIKSYYKMLLELQDQSNYQWVFWLFSLLKFSSRFTSINDPDIRTLIQMNNQDNGEEIRKPRSSKVKILNVKLPSDISSNAAEDLKELISRLYNSWCTDKWKCQSYHCIVYL